MLSFYDGIPVGISDYISDAQTQGTSTDCSTVYAFQAGEGALAGVTSPGGMKIERVGSLETKDATRTRIKWYTSLALLTMLVESVPAAAETVNVYYTKLHTIDVTSSTVPPRHEDVIATGAAGYAAVEWASFSTNRVNAGGQDVWRHYLAWGQDRLAEFQRTLARHGRRNAVRARRLYAPAEAPVDQSTVVGP
jgi:hypothetical protein